MTKNELIFRIANDTNTSRAAVELVLESLAEVVAGQLATIGDISLPSIGKLSVSHRAARTGRNPRTGQPVDIQASAAVKFKPAKALKDAVN